MRNIFLANTKTRIEETTIIPQSWLRPLNSISFERKRSISCRSGLTSPYSMKIALP